MNLDFNRPQNTIFGETVERLRIISGLDDPDWLDLLQINWTDYALIRAGLKDLPVNTFLNLSDHFKLDPRAILQGKINFQDLQIQTEKKWEIPESYSYATYGRSRTTITSLDYIEKYHGWRLRYDILKHLGVSERILKNPFAPISMQVITDALTYMGKRQFRTADFYAMGIYTYTGNANTLLADHYSKLKSPQEVIENMIGECLQFYEKNCIYKVTKLDENEAVVEVTSDPNVADEMNVRNLGNEHVCWLKAGWLASTSLYLGQQPLKVIKTSCVHKGDACCRYEITFASALNPGNSMPLYEQFQNNQAF